jgi:hypothetical protein
MRSLGTKNVLLKVPKCEIFMIFTPQSVYEGGGGGNFGIKIII